MTADPPRALLDRIEVLGVEIARWPLDDGCDQAGTDIDRRPTLYLVERDAAPPRQWGHLDDWVRLPAPPAELLARAEALLSKANRIAAVAHLDDTVLRIGGRRIILSNNEASLLRVLLDRPGQVVRRQQVEVAIWPAGPPSEQRALDNPVKTLRKRLSGAPLRIHVLRERGLLAELQPIGTPLD